ncbi:hypothetical protein CCAX7_20000 [Capsulimonas corticalis]|uniref:Uncharacterized protein n=1 Tax=Capsulimonas corticalis TaxID=2219043 RepID=A0A402D2N0_9BACT|nr:hypothetical protein [Capsulimonas corticalis]BDI29949.1 hypothetical protein CCAX7_20000 [Capsulimonas corticalis]
MIARAFAPSAAILLLAACALRAEPYDNPNGFSLDPPAHWTLAESKAQDYATWTGPGTKGTAPTVSVSVQILSGVVVPAEALPRVTAGLLANYKKTMNGFAVSGAGKGTLGGAPTRYLSATYRQTAKSPLWKLRQVIAIRGRQRIVVTCAAPALVFAKDQPAFDRALASFHLGTIEPPAYRSDEGYRLTPVRDWTAQAPQAPGGDVHFVEPGLHPYPANLGLHISPVPPAMTIDDLSAHRAEIEAGLAKEAQYVPVDHGTETVAGEKAMFITAQLKNPQIATPVWVRLAFVLHGGKLYRFTGLCPDADHAQYDAAFQMMIQSLRWTK